MWLRIEGVLSWCHHSLTFVFFKILGSSGLPLYVLWTLLYGTLDSLYSALDYLYSVLDTIVMLVAVRR